MPSRSTASTPSKAISWGLVQNQTDGTVMNVMNLTIDATHLADICDAGSDALAGIRLDGASGDIHNNAISLGQGLTNESGCQEGDAIDIRNSAGTETPSVKVHDNTVAEYMKTGALANGSVAVTITGNMITGAGNVNHIAQNGIQISRGATARITGNEVSGNSYSPKSFVACGILLYKAGGVSASKNGISYLRTDNTLRNNEEDVCNAGKGGGFDDPDLLTLAS